MKKSTACAILGGALTLVVLAMFGIALWNGGIMSGEFNLVFCSASILGTVFLIVGAFSCRERIEK